MTAPVRQPGFQTYPGFQAFREARRIEPQESHNIWRETGLRYFGYADELGEALAPFIGEKRAQQSYYVAGVYGLIDLFGTARKTYLDHAHRSRKHQIKRTVETVVDGLIFHTAATVFVPALMIRAVRKQIEKRIANQPRLKFLPTLVGLAMIPLIGHPVDQLTDRFLDLTYRRLIGVIHPPLPDAAARLHKTRNKARQVSSSVYAPDAFYDFYLRQP